MASSTAAYAAGDQQWRNVAKGDETVSLKGKRRKTVWLSQQPRPLFVTEAEFKAAKYFTRVKKTLLVLYGSALMIVDVAALDAADSATAAGDISVAVLRLISYSELLDVFIVGSSGRTLKIEYGDSSDKPKLASSALVGLEAGTSTAASNGSSSTITARDSNSLETSSIAASEAYSVAAGSTAAGGQAGAASLRVTYDSFTLVLKDATTAQEAAAALIFYRAQHAAAQHWLHQGLHAGFRCDTVALKAVPAALTSSSTEARGNGTTRSREPSAGGTGNSNQPGPYPWGSVSSGWGCSVALPASWGSILDTAEDSAPANAADGADIVLEDLSCPLGLSHGPQALQLQFTTPLGLAAATIKPQHVRAALLSQHCRQILAVPAQRSGGLRHHQQPQQQGVVAGFSWTVTGRVPAGSSQDGTSSSNLVGVAASAPSATSLAGNAAAELGPSSSSGLTTSHSVEVFAAVTVEVHRTPHTAGRRGAGRVYNPAIPAAAGKPPEADKKLGQQQGTGSSSPDQAAAAAASSTGSNGKLMGVQQLQPVQLAVCAVIAAVAAMQWGTQPAVAVVQMLLAIILAGMTWYAQSTRHSSSTESLPPASSSCSSDPAADAVDAADSGSDYTDASAFETDDSMTATQEDITCCGWSLRLIAGDVVATPSQYLQLQISIARADKGLAQLRQRMLSMSQSMSLSFGGAPPLSVTGGLPVLVSEPEPAWLYPDNKQRFLNAKPTLAASQEQAQRTHKWRLRTDIDNVLRKPCPGFEAISSVFPTYTLMNNSLEGHAVVMMKVGAVKDLCDLVFNPPEGKGVTLEQVEQTLALFNEYLVHVAAPDPLPAGFQVQIYDFEGFKLGYVNSDMITLFKILVRFGHYYPERLKQALVINAPAWFTYPWKMMSSFLDANTSAKVVVVGPAKTALSTLAHHMGGVDNVPVAWGGKNTTPLAQFPDHQQMMEFARRLNAGEQPLKDCKKVSAMFAEPQ